MKLSFMNYRWGGVLSLAALCLAALGPRPVAAQCLSGLGATSAELSSQAWPRAFSPVGVNTAGAGATEFKSLTSVTNDGSGAVYVLDAGASAIYEFSGTNGVNPVLKEIISLAGTDGGPAFANLPIGTAPTSIFYAGGTLWAVLPNQTLAYLMVGGFLTTDATADPHQFQIFRLGADATGATFDGQFVWFTTKQGFLYEVQPPKRIETTIVVPPLVSGLATSYVPPAVVNSVLFEHAATLTPPIFDGTLLWTTVGVNLVGVDIQSGALMTEQNMGDALSNVVFDGTYLWMDTASGNVIKFDPVKSQTVLTWAARAGSVVSTGSSLALYGPNGEAFFRTCDGYRVGTFPEAVQSATFDGTRLWMVSGNSSLLIR